jgi:hypothetical protein
MSEGSRKTNLSGLRKQRAIGTSAAKRPCQAIENKGKLHGLWKSDPVRLLKTNNTVIKSD